LFATLVITPSQPIDQNGFVMCNDLVLSNALGDGNSFSVKGGMIEIRFPNTATTSTTTTTATTTIRDGNDLMQTSYIVTGSESVVVQSDGSWLISGPVELAPALAYNYTQTPYLVQEHEADAPVTMTITDRDPNGVYADQSFSLSDMWLGETAFSKGSFGNVGSLRGVYEWHIRWEGWSNTDNQATIASITITPADGGSVVLHSLYLLDEDQSTYFPLIEDTITRTPAAVTPLTNDQTYYGKNLSGDMKILYDALDTLLKEDLYNIEVACEAHVADTTWVVNAYRNDHPESLMYAPIFSADVVDYIDGKWIYRLSLDLSERTVAQISEMRAYRLQVERNTRTLIAGITDEMTDIECAGQLMRNLAAWSNYAVVPYAKTLISIMVTGEGVCVGYAHSYQYLLQLCGIQARTFLVETVEDPVAHELTYLNVDGKWYVADPTLERTKLFNIADMPFETYWLTSSLGDYDAAYHDEIRSNPVYLTGDFDIELMAPYLAQAYRENTYVYFECADFERSPFEYYYFTDTFIKDENNKQAFIEAINRYLEPDEQLTEWVFDASFFKWGTLIIGMRQEDCVYM